MNSMAQYKKAAFLTINTYMRFSQLAVFSLIFTFSGGLLAEIRFYQASVPVKSQTSQERKRATEDAFLQVLVRMSGSDALLESREVMQKLSRAPRYVEQFQYEALSDETLKQEGFNESLSVSFSARAVRKVLGEIGLPFWSVKRPTTLIWLVEDNIEFGRQFLNQYSDSPLISSLLSAADRRGLPLAFPVLDLEDRVALSTDEAWAVDEAKIVEASARYGADVILVGRYSQTSRGDVWSIWQFFHSGASQSYDSRVNIAEGGNEGVLGEDALYPLADFLAERYAILGNQGDSDKLVVNIEGVDNFRAYRKSLDYLEGLAAVSSLRVASVAQDNMVLLIESEASIEKLLSVINLDNKLKPLANQANEGIPEWQHAPLGSVDNPLQFLWTKS